MAFLRSSASSVYAWRPSQFSNPASQVVLCTRDFVTQQGETVKIDGKGLSEGNVLLVRMRFATMAFGYVNSLGRFKVIATMRVPPHFVVCVISLVVILSKGDLPEHQLLRVICHRFFMACSRFRPLVLLGQLVNLGDLKVPKCVSSRRSLK